MKDWPHVTLRIHYMISQPKKKKCEEYGIGRINEKIIARYLGSSYQCKAPVVDEGSDTSSTGSEELDEGMCDYVLMCGPDGLITHVCRPSLQTLGYSNAKLAEF